LELTSEKQHTALLGLAFLTLLALSSVENAVFFQILNVILQDQLLSVAMLFIHNLLVISLILLGMTFYVNLILNFFKKDKYTLVILEHPRTFALVFTAVIVFLSILRGSNMLYGGIDVETLPIILLISTPIGIVEGYGIYLTLKKTLSRTMTMKDLIYVYGVFLIAAIMEVAFINLLIWLAK
jgi:hypothetical protein